MKLSSNKNFKEFRQKCISSNVPDKRIRSNTTIFLERKVVLTEANIIIHIIIFIILSETKLFLVFQQKVYKPQRSSNTLD